MLGCAPPYTECVSVSAPGVGSSGGRLVAAATGSGLTAAAAGSRGLALVTGALIGCAGAPAAATCGRTPRMPGSIGRPGLGGAGGGTPLAFSEFKNLNISFL